MVEENVEVSVDEVQYGEEEEEEEEQQQEYNEGEGEEQQQEGDFAAGEGEQEGGEGEGEGEEEQYGDEGEAVDQSAIEEQLKDTLDYLGCHELSTKNLVDALLKLRDVSNEMSSAYGVVRNAFKQYTADMDSEITDERLITLKKATEAGMVLAQNMQQEYLSAAMNIGHFTCEPLTGLVSHTFPYARHAAFLYKNNSGTATEEEKAADAERVKQSPSVADDDEAASAAAEAGEETLLDRALNISAEAFETACSMPSQIVQTLVDAINTLSSSSKTFCEETTAKVQPETIFAMADEANYEEAEEEDDGDDGGVTPDLDADDDGDSDLHPDVPCGELVDMEDEHFKLLTALNSMSDDLLSDRISGFAMTPQEIQRLFCNSAELLRIHQAFIPALHQALQETFYPAAIVSLYKKFFPRFERAYLMYIENDPISRFALSKIKDNDAFKRASEFKINDLSISGRPVTSFYQLLSEPHEYMKRQQEHFGALLRQTSASDSVHKDITSLLDQYMTMKKGDKDWDLMKKLISVEESLIGERVVRRGRRLFCRGVLCVSGVWGAQMKSTEIEVDQEAPITLPDHISKFKKKGKVADSGLTVGGEYRCVLFNDEIWFAIPADIPKRSKDKSDAQVLYKVVQKWNVLSIIPRHAPPMKNGAAAFFLHTPDGLYSFEILKGHTTANGQSPVTICELWFNKIESAIRERHVTRVFAVPMKSISERDNNLVGGVPAFIDAAADYIEQEGLNEEGVFRQSAAASVISDLLSEIDSGSVPRFSDVHAAANIIKKWLRDLPDRLLVGSMSDKWEAAGDDPEKLRAAIMELPQCNRATLVKLMHLFNLVVQHQDKNLMSSNNLGIVVGVNMLSSSKIGAQCFEAMLRHYDEVFTKDVVSSSSSSRPHKHRKSKAKSHHKHDKDKHSAV